MSTASDSTRGARHRLAQRMIRIALACGLLVAPVGPSWAAGGGGGHGGGDSGGDGHGGSGGSGGDGGSGGEGAPPRSQADTVDGRYMQLKALWLPITQGGRSRYQPLTARLVPNPDQKVLACYKAPWAQEALLFALTEQPLTTEDLESLDEAPALKRRLLDRVHQHVGMTGLYTDILVVSGTPPPDETEDTLSRMCQ
jgi:hypothetical protein